MSAPDDVTLRHTWPDQPADFATAIVLVRLHGEPLGFVRVPVEAAGGSGEHVGRVASADIEAAVRADPELRAAVERHRERGMCAGGGAQCRVAARPGGALPSVEVIIPTAGRPDRLRRALASLQQLTYPRLALTVVDNRPGDGGATRDAVGAFADARHPVRYLAEPRPGSSVARNSGAATSDADIVAFTDDDVIVEPDWCDWLVEPFREDPRVGATTGLVMPMHLETPAQVLFESYAGFGKGFDRRVYDLGPNRADHRLLYPYWGGAFGSGNSMAFRRSTYLALGGLDPALGAGSPARGGGDIEALSRVILGGERLVYEPRSICWHEHRRDEDALARQIRSYGIGLGAILASFAVSDRSFTPLMLRTVGRRLRAGRGVGASSAAAPRRLVDAPLPPEYLRSERLGILAGPLALARARLWARNLRLGDVMDDAEPGPDAPPPAREAPPIPGGDAPVAVRKVDVAALPDGLDLGAGRSGEPYRAAQILFERAGRPVAIACVPADAGGHVPADRIAAAAPGDLDASGGPEPRPAASRQALVTVAVTAARDEMRLVRCVGSLLESPDPRIEVIVVPSRAASAGAVAGLGRALGDDPRLRTVADASAGRAAARNRALAEAAGEFIAFVDDDVVCWDGYTDMIREAFATDPDAWCLTGPILPLELETRSQIVLEGLHAPSGRDALAPGAVRRVGQGSNIVFRAASLRRLGGFDPVLAPAAAGGGDDLDIIARVRAGGGEVGWHPGVLVWREQPREMLQARRAAFAAGVARSALATKATVSGGAGGPLRRRLRADIPPPAGAEAPVDLRLLERVGMLVGPAAYLTARRRAERQ